MFEALEHRIPDRVPLDAPVSFRIDTLNRLEAYLGVEGWEAVLEALGVDFRSVGLTHSPRFLSEAKYIHPLGYYKILSKSPLTFEDEWGIVYRVTSTGMHWRFHRHPLAEASTVGEIWSYRFPELEDSRFALAEQTVRKYRDKYVIEAECQCTLFEQAWYLRGFTGFIRDLYRGSPLASALLDKLLRYRMEYLDRILDLGVDIVRLGDDLGTQTTLMIPPTLWRRHLKPRMKVIVEAVRKHGEPYIFYHSDGNVYRLIPELVDLGVQILNPVQPECMSPEKVKVEYGDKLTLHGTISIQRTLPFGTLRDVRREVEERVERCGFDGGLIIAPAHAPQPGTPVENIVELYRYAAEYSRRFYAGRRS